MSLVTRLLIQWRRRRALKNTSDKNMRSFLLEESPPSNTLLKATPILVVDLETTSLEVKKGYIASFGWVKIVEGRVLISSAEHHLVALGQSVGQSAIYHQIHDAELVGAESIAQVMARFLEAAKGHVLVFHHAELDMNFLNHVSKQLYGVELISLCLDTLVIEKRKLMRIQEVIADGELRLFACRQRYGLPDYPAHNALCDAIATAELLLAQMAHRGHSTRLSDLW